MEQEGAIIVGAIGHDGRESGTEYPSLDGSVSEESATFWEFAEWMEATLSINAWRQLETEGQAARREEVGASDTLSKSKPRTSNVSAPISAATRTPSARKHP
jgi:hypothetical protein